MTTPSTKLANRYELILLKVIGNLHIKFYLVNHQSNYTKT